jgi:hypothetical protein
MNVMPPISASMGSPPIIAFPASKAASPSTAQPALPVSETTSPASTTKFPVTAVPGETPRSPPMMLQSKPAPAQVVAEPALRAKSSQAPRTIGSWRSWRSPSPSTPRRWEKVAAVAVAYQEQRKEHCDDTVSVLFKSVVFRVAKKKRCRYR